MPYVNQQQYSPMGADIPAQSSPQVVAGAANQGPSTQQVKANSMSQLPEWAAQNIQSFNPFTNLTGTGDALNRLGMQNYQNAAMQYGGGNPNQWNPYAFMGQAQGGAGLDPTQYNLLLGPRQDIMRGLHVNGNQYEGVMHNAYSGAQTGYGSINAQPGLGADFWNKSIDQYFFGGQKGINPGYDKFIDQSLSQYYDQLRQIDPNLDMNQARQMVMSGLNPSKDMFGSVQANGPGDWQGTMGPQFRYEAALKMKNEYDLTHGQNPYSGWAKSLMSAARPVL